MRFGHRVVAAEWSSATARWTVTAASGDGTATGTVELTCRFLFFCSGYYRYERGYEPVLPGAERFAGEIVHPQHWPSTCSGPGGGWSSSAAAPPRSRWCPRWPATLRT